MSVIPISRRHKNRSSSNLSTGFCFVTSESTENYIWAVQQYKNTVLKEPEPTVFLRDGAEAIENGSKAAYPQVPQLLCLWHVNKNVEVKINEI